MSRPKYRTSRQSRTKAGRKRKRTYIIGLIVMSIMVLSAILTILFFGYGFA